jgi:hypothetical protein
MPVKHGGCDGGVMGGQSVESVKACVGFVSLHTAHIALVICNHTPPTVLRKQSRTLETSSGCSCQRGHRNQDAKEDLRCLLLNVRGEAGFELKQCGSAVDDVALICQSYVLPAGLGTSGRWPT